MWRTLYVNTMKRIGGVGGGDVGESCVECGVG